MGLIHEDNGRLLLWHSIWWIAIIHWRTAHCLLRRLHVVHWRRRPRSIGSPHLWMWMHVSCLRLWRLIQKYVEVGMTSIWGLDFGSTKIDGNFFFAGGVMWNVRLRLRLLHGPHSLLGCLLYFDNFCGF